MSKIPAWILALAITAVGAAGTLGYGYQKAQDEGINGTINITTSQAIGVQSITFGAWPESDDSGIGVVAEDGMSYLIGLQLNNGDLYGDPNSGQDIKITLYNYAKKDMIVKLTHVFGVTQPDPADFPTADIHIWYTGPTNNVVGQIDPWTYLIKIPGGSPGTADFYMWVDVGNTVSPGFYSFETFIEPTNWGKLSTANMV